jgi:hypothetical protein
MRTSSSSRRAGLFYSRSGLGEHINIVKLLLSFSSPNLTEYCASCNEDMLTFVISHGGRHYVPQACGTHLQNGNWKTVSSNLTPKHIKNPYEHPAAGVSEAAGNWGWDTLTSAFWWIAFVLQ